MSMLGVVTVEDRLSNLPSVRDLDPLALGPLAYGSKIAATGESA
jgi:hypothetical protein